MKDGKRIFGPLGTLLLVLILTVGCGDDDDTTSPPADNTTRVTIGAAGGTLERVGDVSLTVPAGALAGDIEFTLDENTSPADMCAGRAFASTVFDIGPDGTQFSVPATLTIHYDEADLGGANESMIAVYANTGGDWFPLATTVNENDNTASAEINHLSDYSVTIPYGEAAQGVYTVLEVMRAINDLGFINRVDMITARFDTIIDPCNVHHSLHPSSVDCNDYVLEWDAPFLMYLDTETEQEFLTLGEEYEFEVFGNEAVPGLVQAITFPDVEPYVTNITHEQVLSLNGFTVEWTGTDASTVLISLVANGTDFDIVGVETANDGEHAFTADDLASLDSGLYALVLHHYNLDFIDATGYDPNSSISAGTLNMNLVNLASDGGSVGPDGGVLPLGDDGHLTIPAGALSANVDFTAEVNPSPRPAPDGWAFVTPVYTIEPTGTTFAIDAELHFDYDEADLNGADESGIGIVTDTGSGWTQVPSNVFESMDWVEAEIDHLSDFVAMVEVGIPAEGVYCELLVRRIMTYYDPDPYRTDDIIARFDAVVGPDPVTPLDVDGAAFNAWDLEWDDTDMHYDWIVSPLDLLSLGASYTFVIDGDADVPDLTQEVTFIAYEPYVTNLAMSDAVPPTGFGVEWGGAGGGTVHLTIYDGDEEVVFTVETANDGDYTITADDLEGIPYGYIRLELSCITTGDIVEEGYDPDSFWKTYSYNFTVLLLQE